MAESDDARHRRRWKMFISIRRVALTDIRRAVVRRQDFVTEPKVAGAARHAIGPGRAESLAVVLAFRRRSRCTLLESREIQLHVRVAYYPCRAKTLQSVTRHLHRSMTRRHHDAFDNRTASDYCTPCDVP